MNLGITHQGVVGSTREHPSVIPTAATGSYPPTLVGSTQMRNGVMEHPVGSREGPLILLLVVVRVVDALHEGLAVGDLVRQGRAKKRLDLIR